MKDILVLVDATDDTSVRLRLALDLASRHGGRLTAYYPWERSDEQMDTRRTAEMGLVSAKQLDKMTRLQNSTNDAAAERVRTTVETLGRERGVETEWRCVDGPASDTLPQHARYADLCIVGHRPAGEDASSDYTFSEKLLFVTGRPILFVPSGQDFASLGRQIAVGWNSSRAAARSFNDATALIERAERTTIITINARDYIDRNRALPAEQLTRHLELHGVSADLVQMESIPPLAIADELQSVARKRGADLLVAGAFGHPKLWEKLFGGVTRGLLDHMTLPTFMSY